MLKRISIFNVKGIDSLTFDASTFTVLSGANGTGKTSVLRAIRGVFEGGHCPELIRQGSDTADVHLELADGVSLSVSITQSETVRKVYSPQGNPLPSAPTYIKKLAAGLAYDPLRLLAVRDKERVSFILNGLKIHWTVGEIQKITGPLPGIQAGAWEEFDLSDFDAIRSQWFSGRTEANRNLRQAQGTLNGLRETLPAAVGGADPATVAQRLQLNKDRRSELSQQFDRASDDANRDWHAMLRQLKQEQETELDAIRTRHAKAEKELDQMCEQSREAALAPIRNELTELGLAAAVLQEHANQNAARFQADKQIQKLETQVTAAQAKADDLDRAVKALDVLRASRLAQLPIPGLILEGDTVTYSGLPFDELNDALKYRLAFQIAACGRDKNPLGLMIADGGESLTPESLAQLKEECAQLGYQVILARVSESPELEILTGSETMAHHEENGFGLSIFVLAVVMLALFYLTSNRILKLERRATALEQRK